MRHTLDRYRPLVGSETIDRILRTAARLRRRRATHINSTYYGGGVAELLTALVLNLNAAGIRTSWHQLRGSPDFFNVTKSFHNALQGAPLHLTAIKRRLYEECNATNAFFLNLDATDTVFVHDPQPLPLITHYPGRRTWIWRCHVDLSSPNPLILDYLAPFLRRYDHLVVSLSRFALDLPIPQSVIAPSIDPFSYKNEPLHPVAVRRALRKAGIPHDRPLITQVSRFDRWKDPVGVIRAFRLVRKRRRCRLVLLGSTAADDPESAGVFRQLLGMAGRDPDICLLNLESDHLVNALQRASAVVVQKSLREGFGLTASEALWKGTPVVVGDAGGLAEQVIDGRTGFVVGSVEQCANRILALLRQPALAHRMGRLGRERVRTRYLAPRELEDHLDLLLKLQLGPTRRGR